MTSFVEITDKGLWKISANLKENMSSLSILLLFHRRKRSLPEEMLPYVNQAGRVEMGVNIGVRIYPRRS